MQNQYQLIKIANEFADSNNLKVLHPSGKGNFKETYCVTDVSNTKIALKLIPSNKYNPSRTKREINASLKCDSSLIAKLYKFGQFKASNNEIYYYSLEEYLGGGNLTEKINKNLLNYDLIKKYFLVLIKAIDYLSKAKLVHRDIKPDNIMFRTSSDEPVLVDLGIVRDLSESSLTQNWLPRGPGTPYYSSPEQLNNEKRLINWKSDQFSLGIVLGICLTSNHPFCESGMNEMETVQAIAERKKCSESFRNKISEIGYEGILKMLAPWPIQRYHTTDEIIKLFT